MSGLISRRMSIAFSPSEAAVTMNPSLSNIVRKSPWESGLSSAIRTLVLFIIPPCAHFRGQQNFIREVTNVLGQHLYQKLPGGLSRTERRYWVKHVPENRLIMIRR